MKLIILLSVFYTQPMNVTKEVQIPTPYKTHKECVQAGVDWMNEKSDIRKRGFSCNHLYTPITRKKEKDIKF